MATTAIINNTSGSEGVISYNGYTLLPARDYHFQIDPTYDQSGRRIVSRKFLMRGKFWVFAESVRTSTPASLAAGVADTSTAMQMVRNALSVPGKLLTLTGLGFGDMTIGPGAALKDIEFGPKPQVLNCEPAAGLLSWEVEWIIEWQLPYSTDTAANQRGVAAGTVIAFNYETETDTDHRGLMTRTISGYWQIAQNTDSASVTPASSLKSQVLVAVPKGFRRRNQKFKDNAAKNICTFSYVDEELSGRAYPDGIIEADVDYELESETLSFAKWRATLSGTIEAKPGAPRTLATEKFMAIVRKKVGELRAAFKASGQRGGIVIPEQFRIKGGLFSRRYAFSFSFRAIGCLKDIIVSSGMYSALPESNWERWSASLKEVWQPGGTTELSTPVEVIFETGQQLSSKSIISTAAGYRDTAGSFSGVFALGDVDEKSSWLEYENYIRAVSTSSFAVQKIAQEADRLSLGGVSGSLLSFLFQGERVGAELEKQAKPANAKPDVVKYTGKTTQYIIQYGKALRVKYPVNIPKVANVGGAKPVCVDQEIEPSVQVATVGSDDVPVFCARWAQLYYCPEGFSTDYLNAAANPVHCPVPTNIPGQHK